MGGIDHWSRLQLDSARYNVLCLLRSNSCDGISVSYDSFIAYLNFKVL